MELMRQRHCVLVGVSWGDTTTMSNSTLILENRYGDGVGVISTPLSSP